MLRKLVCKCIAVEEEDGSFSLVPEIPFADFPPGARSAEPDHLGTLHWYVWSDPGDVA